MHLFILLLSKTDETMDKKIYYSNVPDGFVHCFNASCEFAVSCLRFQMGRVISSTCKTVNVVNPSFSSLFEQECPEFVPINGVHYAFGMDHLYDSIPYGTAVKIKQHLLMAFGKNIYYRYKRKEKCFTPSEQAFVYEVFKLYGVKERPMFDFYEIDDRP